MTNAELISFYTALLIIQYNDPGNQPNAIATIQLLAGEGIANQVVNQVGSGFALSTIYGQSVAQGVQLDILAQWVGAVRLLPGYVPTGLFYGFEDTTASYDPDIGGMGDTTVGPPADFWESTNQTEGSYTLSDGQMIQLIQYLAAVNNAYYSVADIDNILFEFFGVYAQVNETATMQITITEEAGDPGQLFGIVNYLDAFPHPAGVQVVVTPL